MNHAHDSGITSVFLYSLLCSGLYLGHKYFAVAWPLICVHTSLTQADHRHGLAYAAACQTVLRLYQAWQQVFMSACVSLRKIPFFPLYFTSTRKSDLKQSQVACLASPLSHKQCKLVQGGSWSSFAQHNQSLLFVHDLHCWQLDHQCQVAYLKACQGQHPSSLLPKSEVVL